MIYTLVMIAGVLLVLVSLILNYRDKKKRLSILHDFKHNALHQSVISKSQAVDLQSLLDRSYSERVAQQWSNFKSQLGNMPEIKLAGITAGLFAFSLLFNQNFLRESPWVVSPIIIIIGYIILYQWLQGREQKNFESQFPDALNMLTGAVSSGDSIMHAIMYVGKELEGNIGEEFRIMGQRLQLGESPDEVFRKSCHRYPYPSFYFFVITLRANIARGGQLKDIMQRLNRTMFNARAIDKKKMALTSEARTSAKIVAAIPFLFLFMLQFLSPENYEFVMFNDDGKVILYYVIISEAIGITIVWALMRSVR
ncbi:pilus assembly protein TadB [Vibrio sp. CAIM 722]|uniref:Pilus assembly protein TadB n=1 Tax=Vibrio eleionomae TaxID=2653505 RepID=A0A7X4LQT0_9VIBR|nr:type II secretion system F family protein [Vibrio eleionomae]MZI96076.1 pilus assembly protein TadB [Vibrio eleionomae]